MSVNVYALVSQPNQNKDANKSKPPSTVREASITKGMIANSEMCIYTFIISTYAFLSIQIDKRINEAHVYNEYVHINFFFLGASPSTQIHC